MKPLFKTVAVGALLGAVTLGIGGRLFMRMIALTAGADTSFSWGGTFELIGFGAIVGLLMGFLGYPLLIRQRIPRWARGLMIGAVTYLAILAAPIEGKAAADSFPELVVFAIVAFGVLFLLTGLALAYAFERLWPRPRQSDEEEPV